MKEISKPFSKKYFEVWDAASLVRLRSKADCTSRERWPPRHILYRGRWVEDTKTKTKTHGWKMINIRVSQKSFGVFHPSHFWILYGWAIGFELIPIPWLWCSNTSIFTSVCLNSLKMASICSTLFGKWFEFVWIQNGHFDKFGAAKVSGEVWYIWKCTLEKSKTNSKWGLWENSGLRRCLVKCDTF